MTPLGRDLEGHRRRHGLAESTAAGRAGMAVGEWRSWMRSRIPPPWATLTTMCAAVGADLARAATWAYRLEPVELADLGLSRPGEMAGRRGTL